MLGQRSEVIIAKTIAPFQTASRLPAKSLYATFVLKVLQRGRMRRKRTDRVRSNKEFSSLVSCEPAAAPLLLLLWLLWSDAIKDT